MKSSEFEYRTIRKEGTDPKRLARILWKKSGEKSACILTLTKRGGGSNQNSECLMNLIFLASFGIHNRQ